MNYKETVEKLDRIRKKIDTTKDPMKKLELQEKMASMMLNFLETAKDILEKEKEKKSEDIKSNIKSN